MIGTLTDAGPLVALIDKDDPDHVACIQELPRLIMPMVTTWLCFTEAMYLLGRNLGHSGQEDLWEYAESEVLIFHDLSPAERARMRVLMAKYKDTPMDLADASLVVAAETLGVGRVFTVDSDFVVYRLSDRQAFQIVP